MSFKGFIDVYPISTHSNIVNYYTESGREEDFCGLCVHLPRTYKKLKIRIKDTNLFSFDPYIGYINQLTGESDAVNFVDLYHLNEEPPEDGIDAVLEFPSVDGKSPDAIIIRCYEKDSLPDFVFIGCIVEIVEFGENPDPNYFYFETETHLE